MPRKEIKKNQIVGIKDGSVYVLEYVFKDGDGFMGATGYQMEPLTKDTVEYMKENQESEYEYLWKDALERGTTKLGLKDWIAQAQEEAESMGRYCIGDDDSFRAQFEDIINDLPADKKKLLPETDLDWNCSGCGRIFSKNMKFDIVFDQSLVDLINQYEKEEEEK